MLSTNYGLGGPGLGTFVAIKWPLNYTLVEGNTALKIVAVEGGDQLTACVRRHSGPPYKKKHDTTKTVIPVLFKRQVR
jgi:hypothetical protein